MLATYLEDLRPRLPQSPCFMADPRSIAVASALQSARLLPARTLEAASIASDLPEAAAALVLSRANHVPVPLAPLLKAYGREALTAVDRAGTTLDLLAGAEAGLGRPIAGITGNTSPGGYLDVRVEPARDDLNGALRAEG